MEAMATCLDLLLKRTGNKPIPEEIVGKMSVSVVRALDYLKENHVSFHPFSVSFIPSRLVVVYVCAPA